MSSTNPKTRGGAGLDDFPTPRWCVHRLLELYELPPGQWLEPCAGAGSIIRACSEYLDDGQWFANELNPRYLPALRNHDRILLASDYDARDLPIPPTVSAIITNPPFALSLPILKAMLERAPQAVTIFLQRLNWAAGPRRELFRKLTPSIFVLPDRPSFVDTINKKTGKLKASTDSIEYAWFVFDQRGLVRVLEDTPAKVRRAEIDERRARPLAVAA